MRFAIFHRITLSALANTLGGTVKPIFITVFSQYRRRDDWSSDISSHVSLDRRSGALDFSKTESTNNAKNYFLLNVSRSLNSLGNICQCKSADRAAAFRSVVDLIQGVANLIHRGLFGRWAERASATPSRCLGEAPSIVQVSANDTRAVLGTWTPVSTGMTDTSRPP
jgi:hypothetical protein